MYGMLFSYNMICKWHGNLQITNQSNWVFLNGVPVAIMESICHSYYNCLRLRTVRLKSLPIILSY